MKRCTIQRSISVLPAALVAAIALAACNPRDNTNAGSTTGSTSGTQPAPAPAPTSPTVGQRVDEVVADAKAGAQDVKRAATEAASSVAKTAGDATITTKINAALAADDTLKATKIDVDTSDGRVVLMGTAPDASSRDRATMLAKAVEGVVAVDNRLTVDAKS